VSIVVFHGERDKTRVGKKPSRTYLCNMILAFELLMEPNFKEQLLSRRVSRARVLFLQGWSTMVCEYVAVPAFLQVQELPGSSDICYSKAFLMSPELFCWNRSMSRPCHA
jgi:hypothetical protein